MRVCASASPRSVVVTFLVVLVYVCAGDAAISAPLPLASIACTFATSNRAQPSAAGVAWACAARAAGEGLTERQTPTYVLCAHTILAHPPAARWAPSHPWSASRCGRAYAMAMDARGMRLLAALTLCALASPAAALAAAARPVSAARWRWRWRGAEAPDVPDVPHVRPAVSRRRYTSEAVERVVAELAPRLVEPLGALFANCWPNTLDTTAVEVSRGDAFVITGDIPALWLRDSTNQGPHGRHRAEGGSYSEAPFCTVEFFFFFST